MYQFAGFNFTFFYKGQFILIEPFKEALRLVLSEVPHFAGRGLVLNWGAHLKDSVIECNNKGVEFSAAKTLGIRLADVAPHTWSYLSSNITLNNAPMAFYDQPLNPRLARLGKAPPLKLRC
jgi:hypothetical protein